MCGSSVDPNQCGTVCVVGSTVAPPTVVVNDCPHWEPLMGCDAKSAQTTEPAASATAAAIRRFDGKRFDLFCVFS